MSEMIDDAERRFRIIRDRSGRLIAGYSMGGYGAIRLALKYPDRFAAAAALGPAIYHSEPPAQSGARRGHGQFLQPDGSFDKILWQASNYPMLLEAYFAQPLRVPMFLAAGDHDELGIAAETVRFFEIIFPRQPAELRIVDGGHEDKVWSTTIIDALKYIVPYVSAPRR